MIKQEGAKVTELFSCEYIS